MAPKGYVELLGVTIDENSTFEKNIKKIVDPLATN